MDQEEVECQAQEVQDLEVLRDSHVLEVLINLVITKKATGQLGEEQHNAKMKKVTKPYFTAAMAKNGKDVEKWAGQTPQKTINNSPYAKCGKKK